MSEQTPAEVAESLGGVYWSVHEDRWETLAPALPDHVADLVAPPILVGAAPCGTDAVGALPAQAGRAAADGAAPTALDRLDTLVPAARDARIPATA